MNRLFSVIVLILMSGCATTGWKRTLAFSGSGAALGGSSGALLSPNDESRGLNALVFGLTGALVGGAISYLTDPKALVTPDPESQSKNKNTENRSQEYLLPTDSGLPSFVRERFQPAIVEEYVEGVSIGEDGTLREPHKVYRIKRHAELLATPLTGASK